MYHKQSERQLYQLVLNGELEIDPEGVIWRVKKRTFDRWSGGTRVTPCKRVRAELMTTGGYLQVRAMIDGKRHNAAAARLVWHHFKGPIPQGLTVNHRDGIKHRNHPLNLELATYSEQRLHAVQVLGAGHHDVKGANNPKAQVAEVDVRSMRRLRAQGWRVKDIADRFGITQKSASHICTGKTWPHVQTSLPG